MISNMTNKLRGIATRFSDRRSLNEQLGTDYICVKDAQNKRGVYLTDKDESHSIYVNKPRIIDERGEDYVGYVRGIKPVKSVKVTGEMNGNYVREAVICVGFYGKTKVR